MRARITAIFLTALMFAPQPATARIPDEAAAPSVRLTGDEVTVPLVLVDEFPFIEGEVNGVKGKLMFDTGANAALLLNHHRIPLKGGEASGVGHFGSGQANAMQRNAEIGSVKFARFSYDDVRNVESQDASQLEQHITSDFLGWIGFEFFRGYAIKIDYDKKQIIFYKDGPAAATHFLHGETVVAVIPFQRRKLARIPIVQVTLGTTMFEGSFDTGQYGFLFADDAMRAKLASEGILTEAKGEADNSRVNVTDIDIGNGAADLALRFGVISSPFPPAEPIGVRPANHITFAYNLLSKYKTVWDYANQRIYLLEYGGD